jgi:hypothetical protein
MSIFPPDDFGEEAIQPPIVKIKADKELEKFKPEKEGKFEKEKDKREKEKLEKEKDKREKEKPEKEKPEKEKREKEGKLEFEKAQKEQDKLPFEKAQKEQDKLPFEKAQKEQDKLPFEKAQKEQDKLPFEKAQKEQDKLPFEKTQKEQDKLPFEKAQKEQDKQFEKLDKIEVAEKRVLEDPGKLAVENTGLGVNPVLDPSTLLRHAQDLEQTGRNLRHFIERSMRPDLGEGALRNEEDLQDDGGDD